MKLTKEHIGKRVRSANHATEGVVVGFDGEDVVLKTFPGDYRTYFNDENMPNPWELVEEPKKPSERITDILGPFDAGINYLTFVGAQIQAVIKYLDEQFEAKSK